MKGKKMRANRREFLKNVGAAGLGAAVWLKGTTGTEIPQIKLSEFNYTFKTFREDEIIKIGMIGTIGHTPMILDDLAKVKNVKLVAYANHNNLMKRLPKETKLYDTYEEMLDNEQIDVAGIFMPLYMNAQVSMAVAKRKIHVITEKPVATTLKDLKILMETVIGNKVRLTTLLGMRLSPPFQVIHNAVTEGKIGEPILMTAQKSYKFGTSRPDFFKKKEMYGGTIPWIGIHAIDYVHFTTGLHFNSVAAFQGNKNHPDYPGCEDYAGVLLTMSNNGITLINIDYLRPETAPSHGDDRLRIIGTEGVIEIKDLGTRVELITASAKPVDIPLPEEKSFLADFIAELRGAGKHVLSPEEPFEMSRVALVAHQSAIQGSVIKL